VDELLLRDESWSTRPEKAKEGERSGAADRCKWLLSQGVGRTPPTRIRVSVAAVVAVGVDAVLAVGAAAAACPAHLYENKALRVRRPVLRLNLSQSLLTRVPVLAALYALYALEAVVIVARPCQMPRINSLPKCRDGVRGWRRYSP
jgi:hypothetical protein